MANAGFQARFKMYVDRPGVMSRVNRWALGILSRTGAYGRGVMKNQIRPPKRGKKSRSVSVSGQSYIVSLRGLVVDAKTGRPVRKAEAQAARIAFYQSHRGEGVGKPPRQGPTNKLRRNIDFGVDPTTSSVVIGAWPFPVQPALVGAKTVPDLLNKGGGEIVGGVLVKYAPRPFVETVLEVTHRKMGQFIEQRPVQSVV
jgi:hypothetical protein